MTNTQFIHITAYKNNASRAVEHAVPRAAVTAVTGETTVSGNVIAYVHTNIQINATRKSDNAFELLTFTVPGVTVAALCEALDL